MGCFPEAKKSLVRGLKISGLGAELSERLCEEFDRPSSQWNNHLTDEIIKNNI